MGEGGREIRRGFLEVVSLQTSRIWRRWRKASVLGVK